jgi:putative transposase
LIRTVTFRCSLPKAEADALNLESGAVYTRVLVEHYRVYRHTGHWLSVGAACRIEDYRGGPTILHAHSRDAAQQAFYKAIKTARTNRRDGLGAKYPHKRKRFRTTIWKNTGMRVRDGVLLLARARGLEPVRVGLPPHLVELPADGFREARLVWDHASRHYEWHLVIEDGRSPEGSPGDNVVAVDLGEIHPAALTDGEDAVIVSCRALRSLNQYTNKRLAKLSHKQAAKVKGSRSWRRLQRRRSKFLAQQRRRKRDIEHKVSREVVNWAVERKAGTIVIGDVRDVADGKRLNRKSQQKVGNWSHGKQRQYITYKAAAEGIEVALQDEAYTSQTCPQCGHRHKPTGREYACRRCGFLGHRDIVGASNILSLTLHGEVGQIIPPSTIKYRQPFGRADKREIEWSFPLARGGKRSPLDTGQVASAGVVALHTRQSEEAAAL